MSRCRQPATALVSLIIIKTTNYDDDNDDNDDDDEHAAVACANGAVYVVDMSCGAIVHALRLERRFDGND